MLNPQTLPAWTDRDSCFRCHTSFSAFTRKHHCRACGETFCSTCSSRASPLIEYGIEDEVRVCESCYERLTTTGSIHPVTSSPIKKSKENDQVERDEDEDALQLAISLSQSEAEEKERQKKLLTQKYAMSNIQYPPVPLGSAPIADEDDYEQRTVDNELAKYFEQNHEQGQREVDLGTMRMKTDSINNYVRDEEIDAFISSANEHINNIKFRMLSNQQRGRNIANDTAVQSVFFLLQHMHPQLHVYIKSLDEKQAYYERLQDKLSQLKDAREALNALRDEYMENKRHQAFERERQRQLQLAMKLEDMRQKKQTYLDYQRQLHLQRLAEQEAEMQARLDQQRRYTQQREQQNHIPYVQPSSAVGYYQHPILPSHQLTSQTFSMGPLSDALIQPVAYPLSHIQQPCVVHSAVPANEQTLIAFD